MGGGEGLGGRKEGRGGAGWEEGREQAYVELARGWVGGAGRGGRGWKRRG